MQKLDELLLEVWREVCRHNEIGQSTETIARLLVREVPIDQILIRRIDLQRSCLETIAVGLPGPEYVQPETRTEFGPAQMERLLAWCRRGRILRGDLPATLGDDLALVAPAGASGHVVAGPLGDHGEACGILVLIAPPHHARTDEHAALVETLLDPFSVALSNDHRLRELAALREAAEADNRSLLSRLGRKSLGDTIVGAESGLRAVMERVELVARSDVPVLVFGETGTGKELLARTIHARSPRHAGPVNRVNCGAIPPELIDSQLFGHERGAFTGAVEARKGWFERADGGTLFLDEIGDLPLAAQVRLLRILQDGWLERVGGQHPIHVDVRIVAATHRDLAAMVAEGKFREDLWYRIAVFPILLPPLRERPEDIPALARHFAERAATRFGLAPVMPTPQDIGLLVAYPWPGNIRELGTVIDRAAILGDGKRLEVAKALGVSAGHGAATPEHDRPKSTSDDPASTVLPLNAAMRQHIEAALAATRGRIEGPRGAAAVLKINPHTLRAKMRKLGIDWARFRGS